MCEDVSDGGRSTMDDRLERKGATREVRRNEGVSMRRGALSNSK
jgi:hypothetical protein